MCYFWVGEITIINIGVLWQMETNTILLHGLTKYSEDLSSSKFIFNAISTESW